MDDFEEMIKMAMDAAEIIKNTPDYMKNYNLIRLCKTDSTGKMEPMARILAAHGVPVDEVLPCMMELLIEDMKAMKEMHNK